ncbi:U3 small nucleolar RNA-associated protein 5 [Daldinia childiae]|uniref:U3 small nucleolar RNA-associated protein 5 n=1 Tax=Daldinia childiae TaxID=326645 RepID=UPI001445245A|nr:U3 small nucleolar RNA-associated protein 5 [Daldinia childiae]KAF3071172.1 U3 small nucleolar RNA-associated protein 5 [Daldinia childiae]
MSTKRKAPSKIAHPVVKQSAKKPLKTIINESETAVSVPDISKEDGITGEKVIEISSDSGSSEYEFTDEEDNETKLGTKLSQDQSVPKKAQNTEEIDIDMPSPNLPTDGESDQEPAQPTFGELARAHDTIEVTNAISTQSSAVAAPGRSLAPPSLSSLGTVLSQALRTDDADLLESCLHVNDLNTVRQTIQRLDSTLAGTLLTKLATRMHRRPGRAGSLMTWVQWTLIVHGGALATQPGLAKKLSELHRVLEERSRGLNSLLVLKGKLDLLEAQMEFRRIAQQNREVDESDEEEAVVYVEGEESDADMVNGVMDLDDDDGLPVTNGVVDGDSEDDEESSEGEEDEENLDGQEDLDENDVNHEDVESDEEDSEAEVAEPQRPAKRSRTRRR